MAFFYFIIAGLIATLAMSKPSRPSRGLISPPVSFIKPVFEHFNWNDLIISANFPGIAKKLRDRYPDGSWPEPYRSNMARHIKTVVEPLRNDLGIPLRVISGWRPPELNNALRGSGHSADKKSAHLVGLATDIIPLTKDRQAGIRAASEWAKKHKNIIGAFIIYGSFFHVNSRGSQLVSKFNSGNIWVSKSKKKGK